MKCMTTIKNRVQLIGNLGGDPDVKDINGTKMTRFSIATTETYKDSKGSLQKQTQWHNLIAWGKTAEHAANLLKKGAEIAIEGKLNQRSYEKDGQKKYVTEIVMDTFNLITRNKQEEMSSKAQE